ncbi:MAG: PEGA domain-containing protein [Thermotogota bacterium]|nr:PEGA domain-containing protein [Thermotogota bacterium]
MAKKGLAIFILFCFLTVILSLTAFSQQCKVQYPARLYGRLVDVQGGGLAQYKIEIYYLDFIQTPDFFGAIEKLFMRGMSDAHGWFELWLVDASERYPEKFLSKVYIKKGYQEFYKYLNVNAQDFPAISGIQQLTINPEDKGSLFESEWVAVNRAISDPEKFMQKSLTQEEKAVVRVEISTRPKGAYVEINGVFIGTSDLNIFLEKGKQYTIRFYKGNLSETYTIDTTEGAIPSDGLIQIQWDINK